MMLMEITAAKKPTAATPDVRSVRFTRIKVNTVNTAKMITPRYFTAGGISLRDTPKGSTRTRCIPATEAPKARMNTTTATVRYPHHGRMISDVSTGAYWKVRLEKIGVSKTDRKSTRLNSSHVSISY